MADIKEITNRWLARNTKAKGILACGVRYADETTFNQVSSSDFSLPALDNSWNCIAATFQFLRQQETDVDQMCWVFENHRLFCATRADEACLGIFASKNEEDYDAAAINRMISEFRTLRAAERVVR